MKQATNPESGAIQYLYDNNGNLTKKTDARLVETTYGYDALNRVTARNYTAPGTLTNYEAAPNVSYTYDDSAIPYAKGKLTKVTATRTGSNAFSAETFYQAFDQLGRITQSRQTVDGVAYGSVPMTYQYNLSGALVEQQYPSGRIVKNVLDADGDLAAVKSKKNAVSGPFWNYADNFTYTAAGAVSSLRLGNGRWESTVFNERLQPTQIALGTTQFVPNSTTQFNADLLKLNFAYGTTANNGNVLSQTITAPSETHGTTTYPAFVATQVYSYDALNRLKSAEETSPTQPGWKQTFLYDRFGNRNFDTGTDGSVPRTTTLPLNCATAVCNPAVDPATNKLIGYVFDEAGNTKTDANGKQFTYDSENKQTEVTQNSVTLGRYFYDGDGKRVKKVALENNQLVTTIFVYDASGKLVAEYENPITAPTPQVSYLTSDNLGSPRINTDANGTVISRHDYQPFGEEVARTSYGGDAVRKQFTSYERDTESGLDFAQARYYAKNYGRFTTTDPLLASGKPITPQTWNRYAYVINNPLRFIDPNGLCTAPTGLQKGQVGICFEAFIAQPRVGAGNLGHGDSRTFAGNDPSQTARITVWAIVSTNETTVNVAKSEQVSPSLIGGGKTDNWTVAKTGVTDSSPQSLQGTATTGATLSNINSKVGEKDFGAGVDVTVSIANGTNGGQQLTRDIQTTGAVMAGTSPTTAGQVAGAVINGVGRVGEAFAPAGTIDGNFTVRATGSGQVTYVGGNVRGFPSYGFYVYTRGADGNVQQVLSREVRENQIEDLTKPLKKVP